MSQFVIHLLLAGLDSIWVNLLSPFAFVTFALIVIAIHLLPLVF